MLCQTLEYLFAIIPCYLTAPNPPPSHSSASLVPQTVLAADMLWSL